MNGAADEIIRVEGLTAAYGEEEVLRDVSFGVRRGEIFIIIGGSGSGKSTLLKQMIGLHRPVRGRILIDGEDLTTAVGRQRERLLRKFGVTFQSGALFGSRTLLENVCLPLEEFTRLPPSAIRRVAMLKLSLVGLGRFAERMPAEVSGGMQKRAGIARAMALDPQILFLDEPSAGLDPITSAELDQLIQRLSASLGITFVVVTHELPSIYQIAGRVIMLGRNSRGIIAAGDPRQLREQSDDPYVRQFFRRSPDPQAPPAGESR